MFGKILLAVDGSEHARKAVAVVGGLARELGSEAVAAHIREEELPPHGHGVVHRETRPEAFEIVDRAVSELEGTGVEARGEVRSALHGRAASVILDLAKEEGAELIVMGTRGLTDWSGLLLGSVSHKVLHMAECPVLLVR